MSRRMIIESYSKDIAMTVDQLTKFVGVYKTLIDSASSVNSITIASKTDVKEALKRARKVGDIIDEIIDSLDYGMCTWSKYLKLKTEYIHAGLDMGYIESQIDEDLRLQG